MSGMTIVNAPPIRFWTEIVNPSARSVGPTRIAGRPGGSQRAAPRTGPAVAQTSAAVTSKPTRKSQGSRRRRRSSSGISQIQAGSS